LSVSVNGYTYQVPLNATATILNKYPVAAGGGSTFFVGRCCMGLFWRVALEHDGGTLRGAVLERKPFIAPYLMKQQKHPLN
jgi:hypothetical protein